mgnify:CR=1 FL=1
MTYTPVTKKQKELLDYLRVYIDKWGFAPTYKEIGVAFNGLTEASIWGRLQNLQRAGRIKIYFNRPRGIEILT